MTAAAIKFVNVEKSFGSTKVLQGVNAEFERGAFTVVLGPSGCGKTTMLNLLAGLEEVSSGKIFIEQKEVQHLAPKERGIAMVFQNYALYPHMTVADNIGYSLKIARVSKQERLKRIEAAAQTVSLVEYLNRRPGQLSGGQRQRVAIARAIVREPAVLLFDEPLSNLDAKLRHGMRKELSELHQRIASTIVFVTHDQVEAMTLADRIMILNNGRIEQYDSPFEIYHRPASTFVASFIGAPAMNLINVTGRNGWLSLRDGIRLWQHHEAGQLVAGIRPEHIAISEQGIDAQVVYREDLGSHAVLTVKVGTEELLVATQLGKTVTRHDRVRLNFPDEHLHLFHAHNGTRLA